MEKQQKKEPGEFATRKLDLPTTPTGNPASPVRTPPTAAPPLREAKALLRGTEGFKGLVDVDALLRQGPPVTPRGPSAPAPDARPPLAERRAAQQTQPLAAPQKRRSASDADSRRKRLATASAAPPQRPRAAPRLAPAARAPPTALAPVAPTGGGVQRQKRPAPPSDAPNGSIKFEPNPYPKNGARWTAYEQYKDSQTLEAFFKNRGTIEDLARDHRRRLVSGLPRVMDWVRKLQQRKKAKTGSQ